jgi:hypothetical protein
MATTICDFKAFLVNFTCDEVDKSSSSIPVPEPPSFTPGYPKTQAANEQSPQQSRTVICLVCKKEHQPSFRSYANAYGLVCSECACWPQVTSRIDGKAIL